MNNFKNNKLLPVLTILLLVVNIITLAMLWTNNKRPGHDAGFPPAGPGPLFEFVTKELNLDEQQQRQYKMLREEHQLLQRPLVDSIGKARDAFFDLLKDSTATDAAIETNNQQTIALQGKLELVNFKHFQKLRAICNTKQQQKFDEIIQIVLRRLGAPRPHGNRPPGDHPPKDGEPLPGDMPPQGPPPEKK
jgi:Spy/CpxP family protein refolding chaperone